MIKEINIDDADMEWEHAWEEMENARHKEFLEMKNIGKILLFKLMKKFY